MVTEDLMENVKKFISNSYSGVDKTSSFLSFEPIGCMLDESDFQDQNEEINKIRATEQISILGDQIAPIAPRFIPGSSRISSTYEELIESATFTDSNLKVDDLTPYMSKFGEVKNEALSKFHDGQRASINTPSGSYLPVFSNPDNWYDINGNFWSRKTFNATDDKSSDESGQKKLKRQKFPLMWKYNLKANPEILKEITEKDKKLSDVSKVPSNKSIFNIKKNLLRQGGQLNIKPGGEKKPETQPKMVLQHLKIKPFLFDTVNKEKPKVAGNNTSNLAIKNLNVLSTLQVADRLKLSNAIAKAGEADVAPVHSDQFSMTFDYCIVHLDRPWFNKSLFHYSKLWYCLALTEGYFSTGIKDETNEGKLNCIPSAMILVKDLRIKAAWTNEDKINAKQSFGLGVFNINNSKFVNNELRIDGIQIVGWICEVLPKLPAISDPNLI